MAFPTLDTNSDVHAVTSHRIEPEYLVAANALARPPVKWHYLIANHLTFTNKTGYNIHLPKPDTHTLFQWLLKIISSDQVASIFIESFQLDEVRTQKIKNLCNQYGVKLVNLAVEQ